MTVNRDKRHLILAWGVLECLFFSGMIFGWPGFLQNLLFHNEFFLKLCENGTITENGSTITNVYGVYQVLPEKLPKIKTTIVTPKVSYSTKKEMKSNNFSIDTAAEYGGDPKFYFYNGPRSQRMRRDDMDNYEYDQDLDLSMFRSIWTNSTCPRQEVELQRVFVVSLFLANFLCMFGGAMFDFLGTLKTRMLIITLFTAATLLMAFTGSHMSWLLYPAMGFFSFGGLLIFITSVQISNLYGSKRYMIVGLLVGAFDSSRLVLFLIKVTSTRGMNVQLSFMFITVSIIPFLIGTIALLPKGRIPWPLPDDYGRRRASATNGYLMRASRGSQKRNKRQNHMTFVSVIKTPLYISQVIWFSVLYLRSCFYANSLNLHLAYFFKQDMVQVEHHLTVFHLVQLLGIVLGPIIGILVDRQTKLVTGLARNQQALCNVAIVHILAIMMSIAQCIFSMLPTSDLHYFTYVLEALCRITILTANTIVLLLAFPHEYFGKLFGLCQLVTAFFQLSQTFFAMIIRDSLHGDAFYIHVFLLSITCLVLIHPMIILRHKKNKAAEAVVAASTPSFDGGDAQRLCETTTDDPQMEVRVRILEDPFESNL